MHRPRNTLRRTILTIAASALGTSGVFAMIAAPAAPAEVGRPSGPFNVTATTGPASKQITLSWSPANPNGSAITSYTGRCVAAAANPGLPTVQITTGPSKTSLLIGGLVAGKKYSCAVRATNGFGAGPFVTATPLVVTAGSPPPPPPPPPDPNAVIGSISADITRTANSAGESALGDVVADAFLAATSPAAAGGAVIAFIEPGGLRADLLFNGIAAGEAPGEVTYGEAQAVLPFGNALVTKTLTGDMLDRLLEQQFGGCAGPFVTAILQVSAGFSYTYDTTQPCGSRVSAMTLNGAPIDSAAALRVAASAFLAGGATGRFSVFTEGTNATTDGTDLDALVSYLQLGPIAPGPQNRITRLA